jgi:hypothetical protein
MGLKALSPGQSRRETPTATWDELIAFRRKAKELGYGSIATAALTAWEWLQREEHLFGAFELKHYRPPERPDSVHVVHPKTGEEAWWPLFEEAKRMPNCAQQAGIARRGNCQPMPSAHASNLYRSPPSVAPKEQKQPVCRNDGPILSEWPVEDDAKPLI